jgi:hypothetical protein
LPALVLELAEVLVVLAVVLAVVLVVGAEQAADKVPSASRATDRAAFLIVLFFLLKGS